MKLNGLAWLRKGVSIIIASLILLLCLIIQQVPGLFVLGGVKPILILPAIIAYASLYRSAALSSIFGIICGLGWDIFIGRSIGYFGFFLFVVAVIIHHRHLIIPVTIGSFMMEVTITTSLLCLIELVFFSYMPGYETVTETFSNLTLPTILFTGLFSPVVFAMFSLVKHLQSRKEDIGEI